MDNGELRPPIGSPARPASQDASPFESPETAELGRLANPDGTPRRNALAQALARLGFKPEGKSPRSEQRAAAGTCMDKNLDCMEIARQVVAKFSPSGNRKVKTKRPCGDHYDDENQRLQDKRRRPVFMDQEQRSWNAKLAAAQQQQQQPQIDISTLEELAQPPMKDNSQVSTMRQEADARLKARKRANEGFSDNDSDDDEYTPEQPAQKKPKRDKKPQGLPFREAAGQGQPAMDISDVEIAAAMKIDSDDTDDSDDL
ncbi:MAG: hypothetical protein EBU90_14100 [Proteobacteria bacterium]|nr:hypothetical protein [Pseudomonadota bacterium]